MNKLLTVLEYDKILEKVAAFAVNERAKREISEISPCFEINEASYLQDVTTQAATLKDKYLVRPVYSIGDVNPLLAKAEVGATLLPSELLKVSAVIRSAVSAKKSIMQCGDDVALVKEYVELLSPDVGLSRKIEAVVAGENEVRDTASDLLCTLRRKIVALNNKLKEKLNSYKRSPGSEKFLQDSIVTVREGRFVLPVKAENRADVPGLVHDRSASGSTVYIEPFPIVEMNNELKTLMLAERDEVERILKALSAEVAAAKEGIAFAYDRLILLDVVFAKVAFSDEFRCAQPRLNNRGKVELRSCRHPLINADSVVPIDVGFGETYDVLLITGPNTGGKTVSLKTVGLFCLMAYSGLRLPCADGAEIAVFDNVFCDIGDDQSIAQSLSTFSSHITNIVSITDKITKNSLVLLDEIGAGTDPDEGAALAIGILKFIELVGCRGVITTHYGALKEYALTSDRLKNACMQFDEQTLSPTYKLIIGLPGVSNAIEIGGKLGLNDYIIKNARASLKEEKIQFERVLLNAEQIKAKALEELEEANALKSELIAKQRRADESLKALNDKLAQINNNAKIETLKIVRRSADIADDIIGQMKEKLRSADEKSLLEAKALRGKLNDLEYEGDREVPPAAFIPLKIGDVKVGARVMVKSLNLRAEITAPMDKKGLISVAGGLIKAKVPIGDLAEIPSEMPTVSVKKNVASAAVKPANSDSGEIAAQTTEIKVLGLTVSEAIEILEPYIDSAVSGSFLRIVHGKGTGALGKGLQRYLKGRQGVGSFRYGGYGEGGSGVTIVAIK